MGHRGFSSKEDRRGGKNEGEKASNSNYIAWCVFTKTRLELHVRFIRLEITNRGVITYLNNFPNLVYILPSRSSRRMSCTLQMLYCLEDLLRPREACNCCLQSDDESCPVPAKTRRLDYQSLVCSHPKGGKNPQSHLACSGTLSNLRQQFSDHRTLQIRPNHQDWFCTLHWYLDRTGKFRHSSCKLKIERPV